MDSDKNTPKTSNKEKADKNSNKSDPPVNVEEEIKIMDNHPLSNRTILENSCEPDRKNRPEISMPTDNSVYCNRAILANASDILKNNDEDLAACDCAFNKQMNQTTKEKPKTDNQVLKMKYDKEKIKPYFLEYLNEQKSSTYLDETKDYFNSTEFITDFYSKYRRKVKQVEEYEEKSRNISTCPSNLIYYRDEIPKGLFAVPMEAYALTLDKTETSENLDDDSNHDDSNHSTSGDEYSLPLESKCSSDDDAVKNQQSDSSYLLASADVDPELKILIQEICYGSNTKEGPCTEISCQKNKNQDFTREQYDSNFTEVTTGDRLLITCNSTCCKLGKIIEPTKFNAFQSEKRNKVENDCPEQSNKNKNKDFQSMYKQLGKNHQNTMKVIKAAANDLVDYFSWSNRNDSSLGKTFQKIITNPEQCRQLFEAKKLEDSCGTKIMVEAEERLGCDSNPPIFRDPSKENLPQSSCKPRCVAYPPNDDDPIPIQESLQNLYNAVYEASSSLIEEGKKILGIESEEDKDPFKRIQRSAEKIAKEVGKTAEEFKNLSPDKKAAVIKMGAETVVEKVKDKTENILKDMSHKADKELFRTNSRGLVEKVKPKVGKVAQPTEEDCYDCSVTSSMTAVFNSLIGKTNDAADKSTKEVAMNSEGESFNIKEKIANMRDAVITYFFDDNPSSEDNINSPSQAESDEPSKYRIFRGKNE